MEIMRSVWEFISNNLALIIEGLSLLISLIFLVVALVNKFKTKKVNEILQILPDIISFTENLVGAGNGDTKLDLVLQALRKIKAPGTDEFWIEKIEAILKAPQKK